MDFAVCRQSSKYHNHHQQQQAWESTPSALTVCAPLRHDAAAAAAAAAAVAAAAAPVVLWHLDEWCQFVQPDVPAALPQVEEDNTAVPATENLPTFANQTSR
jgi:hypothetical protein